MCCDPFSKDKKKIKGHYKISLNFSDSYNCALPFSLIPGKKLCARCLNDVKNVLECNNESVSPCDSPVIPDDDWETEGNISASVLSCNNSTFTPTKVIHALEDVSVIAPVKNLTKSSKEGRLAIFDKVIHSVRKNILNESSSPSLKLDDYSSLLEKICNKISSSDDRKERYSLLTLAPQSWSSNQVASYFNVSNHAAKKIIST